MNSVLIVDDSNFFLTLVKSLLQRSGCNILTATSGEEALKILAERKPRVILLDQYMPELSGDKVCRIIKASPETKDIAVIMLTASNKKADVDKCFTAGCDDYITKPINQESLLLSIGKYVSIIKRAHERAPIYESVKYYHDGAEYSGHMHVISKGGAFIMGEQMLPPGSIIRLSFSITKINDLVEATGEVIWNFDSKEKFPQLLATAQGMGIHFTKISEASRNAIIKYIALGNCVI